MQFSPTPTTHTYRERGTYTAIVSVHYIAEVDVGSGWQPVTGELTVDGAPHSLRVYEARTMLVRHTYDEDPSGLGC